MRYITYGGCNGLSYIFYFTRAQTKQGGLINYKNLENLVCDCSQYLQFIDCIHDAVKKNEGLLDRPTKQQAEVYLGLPIHDITKIYL